MKSLLISLLIFTYAQSSFSATTIYKSAAKNVYNALAIFGLKVNDATQNRTVEWAHPVKCLKTVEDGLYYICNVHDEYRNITRTKTGTAAKKHYDLIKMYNGEFCGQEGSCNIYSPDIKCIHNWPNKDYPPEFEYQCIIEKETT